MADHPSESLLVVAGRTPPHLIVPHPFLSLACCSVVILLRWLKKKESSQDKGIWRIWGNKQRLDFVVSFSPTDYDDDDDDGVEGD